ncbi:DUF7715 family protein [Ilumatobacter sp.]|uniref:DUF7715 family protein n=1 Tax=Ilumatobacter sp. TaxID=1967498 RepID=UPI003B52D52A
MRVLVATTDAHDRHQEERRRHPSVARRAIEGELVVTDPAECADAGCTCRSTFCGIASGDPTATAVIVDLPHISRDDLLDAVRDRLVRTGCADLVRDTGGAADDHDDDDIQDALDAIALEQVEIIERACADHEVGTVVVRDGPNLVERGQRSAA